MGADSIASFNCSNDESQSDPQLLVLLCFRVKFVRGAAIPEKFLINLLKNCTNPRKLRSSVRLFGVGQSLMSFLRSSLIFIPRRPTTRPKNSVSSFISSHFFWPTYSLCSRGLLVSLVVRSRCKWSKCSSLESLNIKISSK